MSVEENQERKKEKSDKERYKKQLCFLPLRNAWQVPTHLQPLWDMHPNPLSPHFTGRHKPHLHLYSIGVQSHFFFWRCETFKHPRQLLCLPRILFAIISLDRCLWSPFISNKMSKPLILATTHLFVFLSPLSICTGLLGDLSSHVWSTIDMQWSSIKRLYP